MTDQKRYNSFFQKVDDTVTKYLHLVPDATEESAFRVVLDALGGKLSQDAMSEARKIIAGVFRNKRQAA